MFTIEGIVGDIVYIDFRDQDRLIYLGVSGHSHFLVKGYDHLGLWVEHQNLYQTKTEDSSGKPLPENKIIKDKIEATFLITWDLITTIMHYPNREGYDFPSEFDKNIGFNKED